MTGLDDACAATGSALLALVADWWQRRPEGGFWRGARRIAAAVCRCVCHLLRAPSDTPPARTVTRAVPAPAARTHRRSVRLRHAIVLRAPPTLA